MIRKEPCIACPYRRDVPSGLWVANEYDKLLDYDKPTGEQPIACFACHATPEHLCNGWAVVHSNRGGPYELLALRLRFAMHDWEEIPEPFVPMFSSAAEAAEHGKARIEDPPAEAHKMGERLIRKYGHLQGDDDS